MGISINIKDFDQSFKLLSKPPIIVNNIDATSRESIEELNRLLYVRYEGDSLSILPSCDCGDVHGEWRTGVFCLNCKSTCMSVTERPLESTLWIKAPKGVKALMNPTVWIMLKDQLMHDGCSVLDWLTNGDYRPPKAGVPVLDLLKSTGLPRDFNYFIENFDKVMQILFTTPTGKEDKYIVTGNQTQRQYLHDFIVKYRDRIFCQALPVPSRYCFVTEVSGGVVYADTDMFSSIDAVRTISQIESEIENLSVRRKANRTSKALSQLAEYYCNFADNALGDKYGWARQHIYGTRCNFTGRAVITSIHGPHTYDEIYLPWRLSVSLYKLHLTNKLMRKGMSPNEINQYLYEHTNVYSPELHRIFDEMIAESPIGGLPTILHRNPTLNRLSAQALRATKIKPDINDHTISMSNLVLKAPNADFDGDALNLMAVLDMRIWEDVRRLEPHTGALDLNRVWKLSGDMGLPLPVRSTINEYLRGV